MLAYGWFSCPCVFNKHLLSVPCDLGICYVKLPLKEQIQRMHYVRMLDCVIIMTALQMRHNSSSLRVKKGRFKEIC